MALDKILENILRYIESRFELFKLEVEESLAVIMVKLLQTVITGILGLFMLFFFSAGVVHVLNMWLKSTFVGYFIVGGVYLVLILAVVSKKGEQKMKESIEKTVEAMFEKNKTQTKDPILSTVAEAEEVK